LESIIKSSRLEEGGKRSKIEVMNRFFSTLEMRFFLKVVFIVAVAFFVFILTNYLSIYRTALSYTENILKEYSQALNRDFKLINGKLNSIAYYQDTTLPYDNTVYIITKDGFVIERSKHFTGLLDTANST